MSIKGYTRVPALSVWDSWSKAHQGKLFSGATGVNQKIHYKILDVIVGKSFSVAWKALFVRLIFLHEVKDTPNGAEISYDFKIVGPFAWIVRWWIAPKIRANLHLVLKAFIQKIENS